MLGLQAGMADFQEAWVEQVEEVCGFKFNLCFLNF